MNPKWHKSKELNKLIKNQNSEYINITENIQIEGWPIVAGPVYYKSGISVILHNNSWSISFCYTPHFKRLFCIDHDGFYRTIDYSTEKLINEIPVLRRFTKAFILEGLSIILAFNYFYINSYFHHWILT